jgi:pyridoxine 4-dehydrogenase
VIATKSGMTRQGPGLLGQSGSPDHLRQAVAGSLERLGVAAIDLYQLHRPDPAVPFEISLQALIDLKNEGKIKHIGLSSVTLDQLKKALEMTEIVSVQNKYNVIGNETVGAKNISNVVGLADSEAVLDYCTKRKIAFIPFSPIGGHGADLSALESIAAKHHADVHQIALAWLLARSPIMLPIPGTGSVKHMEGNVTAVDIKLDEYDLAKFG